MAMNKIQFQAGLSMREVQQRWFLAIYLMTQSKSAVSALELKRQLGGELQDGLAAQAQAAANHAVARRVAPTGRACVD